MSAPASLFTCRYWAFGPSCPNSLHGKNVCRWSDSGESNFDASQVCSHIGILADLRQSLTKEERVGSGFKGTVQKVKRVSTSIARQVWMAFIKDVSHLMLALFSTKNWKGVKLNGLNLDIATAAGKSGFDTHNHSALFDLIWAVKRVAIRASKGPALNRPRPRDPVYPDRFRPSGLGDNTKRKRPAPKFVPPEATPVKLESVMKAAPTQRKFRYQNKKALARPKQDAGPKPTGYITSGTQENPVDLLSDNNDSELTGAKRQKLNVATLSRPEPPADTSQAQAGPEIISPDTETLVPRRNSISLDTMQVDGQTYIRTNARYNDGPQDDQGPDERQLQSLRIDLNKVKDALESVESNVEWCNDSMSKAFESYRDVMARRDIHSSLTRLGENLETAKLSSLEGVGHLIDILELVN